MFKKWKLELDTPNIDQHADTHCHSNLYQGPSRVIALKKKGRVMVTLDGPLYYYARRFFVVVSNLQVRVLHKHTWQSSVGPSSGWKIHLWGKFGNTVHPSMHNHNFAYYQYT
ncbi:unnamed protein product [Somion occarium]|uniref:Uncharacterized protein n=1 Tax=Somion occarium TaxID=3059160 RepID=A0ABP1DJJ2_9APHY